MVSFYGILGLVFYALFVQLLFLMIFKIISFKKLFSLVYKVALLN